MNMEYIIRILTFFMPRILIAAVLIYVFKVKPGLLKMAGNYPTGADVDKLRIALEVAVRVVYIFTIVYLVFQIFLLVLNLLPLH